MQKKDLLCIYIDLENINVPKDSKLNIKNIVDDISLKHGDSEEVSEGQISEVRRKISYHHSASCHVFRKTPLSSPVMAQRQPSERKRETIHS